MKRARIAAIGMLVGAAATATAVAKPTAKAKAKDAPRWETLPAPPAMPAADATGDVAHDDVEIHYAVFGKGDAVVLLHGGLGNGAHWANQVAALAPAHRVIVIDSRGQGRSTLAKGRGTRAASPAARASRTSLSPRASRKPGGWYFRPAMMAP